MGPVVFGTGSRLVLRDELYDETIDNFSVWCRANPRRLVTWLEVHREPWALVGYLQRMPERYLYEVGRILRHPVFLGTALALDVNPNDLAYALDVAMRYPRYGELAGEDGVYLSHPLREKQQLPTMRIESRPEAPLALSFSASASRLARSLTLDQYGSLLHEIRGLVEREGLRQLSPGSLEPEEMAGWRRSSSCQ